MSSKIGVSTKAGFLSNRPQTIIRETVNMLSMSVALRLPYFFILTLQVERATLTHRLLLLSQNILADTAIMALSKTIENGIAAATSDTFC